MASDALLLTGITLVLRPDHWDGCLSNDNYYQAFIIHRQQNKQQLNYMDKKCIIILESPVANCNSTHVNTCFRTNKKYLLFVITKATRK